ncbi:MAG: mechanosensitive ion channel family protein, partial [Actinomycetota bacterium]|nr:mechanosensitive ion channel family protein [Actinomycetota bacterium]
MPDRGIFRRIELDWMRRPFTGERGRNLLIGSVAGAIALAGLVIGNNYGNISPKKHTIDPVVIAAACAVGTLVFGVIATLRISRAFDLMVRQRGVPSAAVATRMFTAGLGYVITAFSVLAVLDVSIGKLLIGAGLAGVILGIAAQPSLGNVFSGVVLILTRPFSMGDHIRLRSGALGGLFD